MAKLCKNVLQMPASTNGIPEQPAFRAGTRIRESGIYRVHHSDHRACHEVTLLRNEVFPPCLKCGESVYFELIRSYPELEHNDFRVRLYSIPHLEQEAA